MNTIIYDSKKVLWPVNAPAKSIPIEIESDSGISAVKNVQAAVQFLADNMGATVGKLPPEIKEKNLRNTIETVNQLIEALRKLQPST